MNEFRVRAGATLAAVALVVLAVPALASANVVTQWNANASTALFSPPPCAVPPPCPGAPDARVSILHLAMVHGAVYDAVNAIDGRYQPYLVSPAAAFGDSMDAAAATAAYRVLTGIGSLPGVAPSGHHPNLAAQYSASLAGIPDGTAENNGIAIGEAAATAMLTARQNDGRFGTPGFVLPSPLLPGDWRPTPTVNDPAAWIKDVKPFLIEDASQFRSHGPYALDSPQYAREFNEVKSVGRAATLTRTAAQTEAALYWAENPPRTWSRVFRTLATSNNLSTADGARFYAMLYLTAADAFISVWDDKAHWMVWRPSTAIQQADLDGNPATEKEDGWTPLIANPPYPDHPSGHTGFSGSVTETLKDFFGTDHVTWTDSTVGPPVRTRTFTRCSDAIDEIINARVWSGIHFRAADEQGAKIGKQVARYRQSHYFKPVDG